MLSACTTAKIDPQGRPTFAQITGVEAVNYAYDLRGRITSTTQGTGADLRSLTIGYGPEGFVQTVTDALTQQLTYQRDAAGRITQITHPGSREVGFGFDANSNVTSITPPGRTSHLFQPVGWAGFHQAQHRCYFYVNPVRHVHGRRAADTGNGDDDEG